MIFFQVKLQIYRSAVHHQDSAFGEAVGLAFEKEGEVLLQRCVEVESVISGTTEAVVRELSGYFPRVKVSYCHLGAFLCYYNALFLRLLYR